MLPWYTDDTKLETVKLIASDMDLTLIADDGSLPPRLTEQILALDAAGITFCAASGRPYYTLRAMFAELEGHMAFLADNGAAIYDRKTPVFQNLIDRETYRRLLQFTKQDGRGCPCVCGINACYIPRTYQHFDDYFRSFYSVIDYRDNLDELDEAVDKYTVFFPEFDSEEIYASCYGPAFNHEFSVTNAGKQWIDIMNQGVNKGSALTMLSARLGISLDDCIAAGDTYNDIQMLELAGHAYVVSNAEPHMDAHGTHRIPSNNDYGVAEVLDAILQAQTNR
ncbi:HAD family hydrolase [Collinsella sp. zg1085]|uniref:HAD family hydrolase n=1 Tax=Collinsella sp. zg1085 TaxID=2844380 RepID=UPI001C0CF934|nr:HAD family hydrolase [Collinsella sp. zg1085]QWT17221.1 HAD family hydrolase [Collinsella sp. zg1085]